MIADSTRSTQEISRRIVLAEDDPSAREATTMILKSYGFEVAVFQDGAPALDHLISHQASVFALLTDYEMPDLDGISLIRTLHEKQVRIPVTILISGRWDVATQIRALPPGMSVSFLEKPYVLEKLLALLQVAEYLH